jgi:hypothetical protein
MPERYYKSAEIKEMWNIDQALYTEWCRAREIEHVNLGRKGARRPTYASTERQIKRFLESRTKRAR